MTPSAPPTAHPTTLRSTKSPNRGAPTGPGWRSSCEPGARPRRARSPAAGAAQRACNPPTQHERRHPAPLLLARTTGSLTTCDAASETAAFGHMQSPQSAAADDRFARPGVAERTTELATTELPARRPGGRALRLSDRQEHGPVRLLARPSGRQGARQLGPAAMA